MSTKAMQLETHRAVRDLLLLPTASTAQLPSAEGEKGGLSCFGSQWGCLRDCLAGDPGRNSMPVAVWGLLSSYSLLKHQGGSGLGLETRVAKRPKEMWGKSRKLSLTGYLAKLLLCRHHVAGKGGGFLKISDNNNRITRLTILKRKNMNWGGGPGG